MKNKRYRIISEFLVRIAKSLRKPELRGTNRIKGYKAIPAKNVPNKRDGLNPSDIEGIFSKSIGSDNKLYLTSSLNGAKMYALLYFVDNKIRRKINKDYKRYLENVKNDPEEKEPMSFKEFLSERLSKRKGGKGRVAIIKVELMSTKPAPKKDFTESALIGTGDEYWIDHDDIVSNSIKIKLIDYFSEDDLKNMEVFEMRQKRPSYFESPSIEVSKIPSELKEGAKIYHGDAEEKRGTLVYEISNNTTYIIDKTKSQIAKLLENKGISYRLRKNAPNIRKTAELYELEWRSLYNFYWSFMGQILLVNYFDNDHQNPNDIVGLLITLLIGQPIENKQLPTEELTPGTISRSNPLFLLQ